MGLEVVYMLCCTLSGLSLFTTVYFLITLSDLESDYINSRECSKRLNFWFLPRMILVVLHTVLVLTNQLWTLALFSLPFSGWLIYRRYKQPPGHEGIFDPTEIHLREKLQRNLKECLVFMCYHLGSFFVYMYCIVSSMTANDESPVVSKEMPW